MKRGVKVKGLKARVGNCINKSEQRPRNIFCLGCAIKVPLRSVVYPALRQIKRNLSATNIGMEISSDGYVFETGRQIKLKRQVYPVSSSGYGAKTKICKDISGFMPHSAIVLASFMDSVSRDEVTDSLTHFFKAASKNRDPFHIGKGHTIQISKIPDQKFILADYLSSEKGDYYGVANHDTIVTIDFNLKHSSWLNVLISFNNALNDLYALGVYKDITLYPAYDSIHEEDNRLIRDFFPGYLRNFTGYNYNIVDLGPLGLELEAIGSTVIGLSDREPPRVSGLLPGQSLIVTRPIGDLAALVLYIIRQTAGNLTADIKRKKIDVLLNMATPNIEIAKIIADYLPAKGEDFDVRRHITATKDISGEGLSAFEEMALRSKVDIYLKNIELHTHKASGLKVPNNTSNTNGAIIIAAHKELVNEIMDRLKNAGCKPWIAARAGSKKSTPTIFLKKTLKKYPFIKYRSHELFTRYKFV